MTEATPVTGGPDLPAIRVLLVDDHDMVAQSLRHFLDSAEDISVVAVAVTAADGVDAAARLLPDVVLMDYQLPDGDGVTAAVQIMRELPTTKVVILTGSGEDDRLALRALEAGCAGFVGKGGSIRVLLRAIRAAHAGEAVVAPSMLARLLPQVTRGPGASSANLSDRELEVLRIMAEGATDKEIADNLFISVNTARKHVQNIIRKLGAHSKLEAVVIAARYRVIRPL